MLTLYHSSVEHGEHPTDLAKASLPADVAWIDLLKPEPDEVAFVQRTIGLDVPSVEDLSEIESSSRLRNQNGAIYLSAPLIYRADDDQPVTTPVGFVLTRERLITVRFHELSFFQTFTDRDLAAESDPLSSTAVFAGLMDAIADRLADILENIAAELDALSHRLFRSPGHRARREAPSGARKRRPQDHIAARRPQRRSRVEDPRQPARDRPHRALCRGDDRGMAARRAQASA